MLGKVGKAVLLVLVMALMGVGVVYADEGTPLQRIRYLGEITGIDLSSNSFSLHSRAGEDLRIIVNRANEIQKSQWIH
jgi:hypothetical protein